MLAGRIRCDMEPLRLLERLDGIWGLRLLGETLSIYAHLSLWLHWRKWLNELLTRTSNLIWERVIMQLFFKDYHERLRKQEIMQLLRGGGRYREGRLLSVSVRPSAPMSITQKARQTTQGIASFLDRVNCTAPQKKPDAYGLWTMQHLNNKYCPDRRKGFSAWNLQLQYTDGYTRHKTSRPAVLEFGRVTNKVRKWNKNSAAFITFPKILTAPISRKTVSRPICWSW